MRKLEKVPTKQAMDRRPELAKDKPSKAAEVRAVAARAEVAKPEEVRGAEVRGAEAREQPAVKVEAKTKDGAGDRVTHPAAGGGPPTIAEVNDVRRNPSPTAL